MIGHSGEVHLWEYHGGDNQLWYWDGPEKDILRNKMFHTKVRYFHILRLKDFCFYKIIHICNSFRYHDRAKILNKL